MNCGTQPTKISTLTVYAGETQPTHALPHKPARSLSSATTRWISPKPPYPYAADRITIFMLVSAQLDQR